MVSLLDEGLFVDEATRCYEIASAICGKVKKLFNK